MKKWGVIFVLILALWFALKNVTYQAYLSSGEPIIPAALSYEKGDAWATRPESQPPGAWITPWGIDTFIILPPAHVAQKHGLVPADDPRAIKESLDALEKIGAAIPGETPAYAPFYRGPSPANKGAVLDKAVMLAANDLLNAFEHYLENSNQGRGVIIAMADSAAPYSQAVLGRLQAPDLSTRFAGLVSFGPANSAYAEPSLTCADILSGACYQKVETKGSSSALEIFYPNLPKITTPLNVIDAPGVSAAIRIQAESVSTWMDETQPKPAEPFFATEVIQSAPIYRPGEEVPLSTPSENGN